MVDQGRAQCLAACAVASRQARNCMHTHAFGADRAVSHVSYCCTHRSLPRVGVRTALAWRGGRVAWYGRGPQECYPDRKTAAHVGRYTSSVEDMHVPYIVPGIPLFFLSPPSSGALLCTCDFYLLSAVWACIQDACTPTTHVRRVRGPCRCSMAAMLPGGWCGRGHGLS